MGTKLAIHGATPARENMLAYGKQTIENDDIKAVTDALKGDLITTGPTTALFEDAVAKYTNSKYAVAVSNGTAALHAACFAAGIKKGDEVITTAMTFAASANCVLYQKAKPVFADINPKTYNIDVASIEKQITKKTKAIIPVDYTGQPADLDEIMHLADKHNLIVIEDAAHSIGAEYRNKKIGSIADMTEFSFHPVKHITTGEGGVITTNNREFYEKLMLFRTHGITKDVNKLINKEEGSWYYEQQELGYNLRITDIQCALGISQLKKLDSFVTRRREIANLYNSAFSQIEEIEIPFQEDDRNSSWHLYIIKLNLERLNATRKEIFNALRAENIGVHVHYIPVYYMPYYKQLGYKKGLCPNAESLYERIITLPLFPKMTNKDVDDIIKAVSKVITYYKK
ncbi:MAG: UDP-4-amino-4,6-dideoxy-N-acetyl-beta-L-altrosamine transaminase [Alkaliphilus sp.]